MTTRLERQPSARTPPDGPDRDRFVDVLRVFAIGLVVLQHWLMPVLSYDDGRLITDNAFSGPGGWAVTWISQVMPLVFFAGGAASAMSLDGRRRRSLSTGRLPDTVEWVSGRIRRLAMPVIPLMAVWLPLPYLLGVLSVPQAPVHLAAGLVGQLLWFLALYVIITAASPWFLRLRDRCRGAEVVVMVVAAIGVDVTRFSVLDGIGDSAATALGYVNLVLVWGAIHQIGIHYASGSLRSLHGARAWGLATGGFAATAVAVITGPYAASMVGMPGDPLSNVNPPTAVLLALAAGQLGVALALRETIETWAAAPTVTRCLDWCSARLMTVYVWHTPALVIAAGVGVVVLGQSTPAPLSQEWRDGLPLWLGSLTVVLGVLVAAFSGFERHPPQTAQPAQRVRAASASPGSSGATRTVVTTLAVSAGLLGLTVQGFTPPDGAPVQLASPLTWCATILGGLALCGVHWPTVIVPTVTDNRTRAATRG
ncbi:MAG TPA: acyltransferase, partial [Jiangellaceae bacterium]|nr:acyltransferase [Jiangellaceae bacterium]